MFVIVTLRTTILVASTFLLAAAAQTQSALELPVYLHENIEAGKSPVGMKVEARLSIATLVDGRVIPQGATLSGEVIVSQPKTTTGPARLSVRFDSAQWKNGSSPVVQPLANKIYLTSWHYPLVPSLPQDDNDTTGLAVPPHRRSAQHVGGAGTYPDPNTSASPTYSKGNTGEKSPVDSYPGPRVSEHRVAMKDVESTRSPDGALILTSSKSRLKFDRSTTYVLALSDPSGRN